MRIIHKGRGLLSICTSLGNFLFGRYHYTPTRDVERGELGGGEGDFAYEELGSTVTADSWPGGLVPRSLLTHHITWPSYKHFWCLWHKLGLSNAHDTIRPDYRDMVICKHKYHIFCSIRRIFFLIFRRCVLYKGATYIYFFPHFFSLCNSRQHWMHDLCC